MIKTDEVSEQALRLSLEGMRYDTAARSGVFSQCQPFSAASASDFGRLQFP
jgi:hypothetical protein